MRRVVITGLGCVTPIGNNVEDFYKNLKAGKSGIDKLSLDVPEDFPVKLAAEVKDLDTKDISKRDLKFDSRFTTFARIAAREAITDSKLNLDQEDRDRIGVYISTSVGGSETLARGVHELDEKGANRISPYFIQSILPNTAAAKVSIDFNLHGTSSCHAAACASGTISIGEAFRSIQNDEHDIFLAGASEASITPLTLAGFAAMHAIYVGEDKTLASIPFDERRSGFTIGEGAGILVLEELEHAKKRKAKIYAEVVGYASNSDAFNVVSPDYEGKTCKIAMKNAIKNAGINPSDIDFVNAHATSTKIGDETELSAIKEVFDIVPEIVTNKSQIGHLLAASGAVETIASVKKLEEEEKTYALKNSFGFGGHNASLILKKWSEK